MGMMGSGKSAIGRELAKKLRMEFADVDAWIEKQQGRKISAIFEEGGEALFRRIETDTLAKIARRKTGTIVSCGGGIVLADENVRMMRDTGTVVLVRRDIETIIRSVDTKKRPLLKDGAENARRIFRERAARYEACCDLCIENDGTIAQAAEQVISKLKLL